MTKRKERVENQSVNFTPDHSKLGIIMIYLCVDGMQHIFCKLFTKAKTFLYTSSQSEVYTKNYGRPKLWESQFQKFQDSQLGNPRTKWHLGTAPWLGTKNTIKGKVMASPKFRLWWILWVCVCPWFVHAPKMFQPCTNQLII
jgi:hypothetical protein